MSRCDLLKTTIRADRSDRCRAHAARCGVSMGEIADAGQGCTRQPPSKPEAVSSASWAEKVLGRRHRGGWAGGIGRWPGKACRRTRADENGIQPVHREEIAGGGGQRRVALPALCGGAEAPD